MGIVLQRIERDEATMGMSDDEAADLLDLATITPKGLKPFAGARRMVVRITTPNDSYTIPLDDVQQLENGGADTFAIAMPDTPIQQSADTSFLIPDRSTQSDHPKMRNHAVEIVDGAQSDWERVQRIAQWVTQNVAPLQTLSVPAALEVLENRSGGPNEQAVLFAGLAQAAGIPSRIAVGVVWDDTLERFHYHAWPEVRLDRWYWIDPHRSQALADATHIKLNDEGVETWTQTLFTISTIQIEVLEIE
jgi:transglutaminase-like putative cysteine protease